MSKTRVYEWYKRFQDGREDVEDDERPGRPSTSTTDENVEKVKEMIMNDRRITIREVADNVGISIGSCHEIFSNVLGIYETRGSKICSKIIGFWTKTAANGSSLGVTNDTPASIFARQSSVWLLPISKNKENLKETSFHSHRWH